jgi:hypothetical protein
MGVINCMCSLMQYGSTLALQTWMSWSSPYSNQVCLSMCSCSDGSYPERSLVGCCFASRDFVLYTYRHN